MKRTRNNIEPRFICGESEFKAAYGISAHTQAEWRSSGLPCYLNGKVFMYSIDEVDKWIRETKRVQTVEIRM